MRIVWAEKAWDNFLVFEREDKQKYKRIIALIQKYKRIIALIKDIMRNGYNGIGKPEALREDLSGFWSRRIDEKTGWFINWRTTAFL